MHKPRIAYVVPALAALLLGGLFAARTEARVHHHRGHHARQRMHHAGHRMRQGMHRAGHRVRKALGGH